MPDMQTKFVEANGLRFEVLEEETGYRLALCLHGSPFPGGTKYRCSREWAIASGPLINADTGAPPGPRKSQITLCRILWTM